MEQRSLAIPMSSTRLRDRPRRTTRLPVRFKDFQSNLETCVCIQCITFSCPMLNTQGDSDVISSAVFCHFVGQALRNVCYSDVNRRHFLNKIAIVRTFS